MKRSSQSSTRPASSSGISRRSAVNLMLAMTGDTTAGFAATITVVAKRL